jgi:hypothetical protein
MRLVVLAVVLAHVPLVAQSDVRARYQRVIEQQFPGFRILGPADFIEAYRRGMRDGRYGSLLVGRFNSDGYADFAALIVPPGRTRDEGSADGKLVICMGNASGTFVCGAQDRRIDIPHDIQLTLMPPGSYECVGGPPVATHTDSIQEGSEARRILFVRNPDGSTRQCITGD